jgi:hypothetical protein
MLILNKQELLEEQVRLIARSRSRVKFALMRKAYSEKMQKEDSLLRSRLRGSRDREKRLYPTRPSPPSRIKTRIKSRPLIRELILRITRQKCLSAENRLLRKFDACSLVSTNLQFASCTLHPSLKIYRPVVGSVSLLNVILTCTRATSESLYAVNSYVVRGAHSARSARSR